MKSLMSGKVSIFVLTIAFAISAFLIGKNTTRVLANTTVIVCHQDGQSGNYSHISVSVASVDNANGLNGHGIHEGDIWAPYSFNGVSYPGHGDYTHTDFASCTPITTTTPINCVGNWSNTDICSKTCGGGQLQQVFTITTPAANGGTACTNSNGDTRWSEASCNTQACETSTCLGNIPSDENLLTNITEGVTNDVDSGLHGNWAIDNYSRTIKVWKLQTDGNVYCADVRYNGTFDVQPGVHSPGDQNEILTGDEDGTMTGGRRAQIIGDFSNTYGWATSGNVGSYNYNCSISGTCTGRFNWVNKYFGKNFGYTDLNWGWTYTSCDHGQWINASTGNSGDIVVGPTDEVCSTPVPTPTPTPVPVVCGSDEHLNLQGTACLKWELGGAPTGGNGTSGTVLGASTTSQGQVLGASTMAGTGTFEESLYSIIMGLGGISTIFGISGFKKAFKKG